MVIYVWNESSSKFAQTCSEPPRAPVGEVSDDEQDDRGSPYEGGSVNLQKSEG